MVNVLLKNLDNTRIVKVSESEQEGFVSIGRFKDYNNAMNVKKLIESSVDLFNYGMEYSKSLLLNSEDDRLTRLFISDYCKDGMRDPEMSRDRLDGDLFKGDLRVTKSEIKGYREVLSSNDESLIRAFYEILVNNKSDLCNSVYVLNEMLVKSVIADFDEDFEISVLINKIQESPSYNLYKNPKTMDSVIVQDSLVIESDGEFKYITSGPDGYDLVKSSESLDFLIRMQRRIANTRVK